MTATDYRSTNVSKKIPKNKTCIRGVSDAALCWFIFVFTRSLFLAVLFLWYNLAFLLSWISNRLHHYRQTGDWQTLFCTCFSFFCITDCFGNHQVNDSLFGRVKVSRSCFSVFCCSRYGLPHIYMKPK